MKDHKSFVLGSSQAAMMTMANENSPTLYAGVASPGDGGRTHVCAIVMVRKDEVIIEGSVMDNYAGEMPDTTDEIGACLVRVPNSDVLFVYTQQDMQAYEFCRDADQTMLDNAY